MAKKQARRWDGPPYWAPPLDLFKLLVTAGLLALLLFGRSCLPGAATLPALVAPSIDFPTVDLTAPDALKDLTLSGQAPAGQKVRILDGDVELGQVTAGPDGRWSFALPTLAAGSHAIKALIDGADAPLVSAPWSFALPDLKAALPELPSFDMDLPDLGKITASQLTGLKGKAAPGAKLQFFDGETLLGETTAGADGLWSFTLPAALAVGSHSLVCKATGADGVTLSSEPWTFEVLADEGGAGGTPAADATGSTDAAPAATVAATAAPAVAQPVIDAPAADLAPGKAITGSSDPNALLDLYAGNRKLGSAKADAKGLWSFTLPADIDPGTVTVKAVVVDATGASMAESAPRQLILPSALPKTGAGSGARRR